MKNAQKGQVDIMVCEVQTQSRMSSSDLKATSSSIVCESFVDADEAARFLKINRRTLLHWARQGILPAHPLGRGSRKTWRFLVSELACWLRVQVTAS